jgi:hypothetical protein
MALMKTSNPALNVDSFRVDQAVSGEAMTLTGTVNSAPAIQDQRSQIAATGWEILRFQQLDNTES